MKETWR
jgi:hypothetical protein